MPCLLRLSLHCLMVAYSWRAKGLPLGRLHFLLVLFLGVDDNPCSVAYILNNLIIIIKLSPLFQHIATIPLTNVSLIMGHTAGC